MTLSRDYFPTRGNESIVNQEGSGTHGLMEEYEVIHTKQKFSFMSNTFRYVIEWPNYGQLHESSKTCGAKLFMSHT